MNAEQVVYFNSGAGGEHYKLSNFYQIGLIVEIDELCDLLNQTVGSRYRAIFGNFLNWLKSKNGKITCPSAEHLYVMLMRMNDGFDEVMKMGELNEETCARMWGDEFEKKLKYWSKKKMVGILPKMMMKRARKVNGIVRHARVVKKNGLFEIDVKADESEEWALQRAVWRVIHELKYRNEEVREVLLSTQGMELIEFNKSAARANSKVIWGGMLIDGKVVGMNMMGKFLGKFRDELLSRMK